MNPEDLLEQAAVLIKNAHERGESHAHICAWHCKLQVLRRDHTVEPHPVFFLIDHHQMSNGLSTEEWSELKEKLWNFYKEKT